MSTAIRVENISKEYQLGVIDHGMLYKDLQSMWARVRGKPDPNSMLNSSADEASGRFLALHDVSFNVEQGDIVGVIGKNGAGKSTLLKILSRITTPTRGTIRVKGRMASLLEVGTGFHPELTGRENIFLNGAILGMRKSLIKSKLDEIVDFSGVEAHIDTPVKRYSSGMYVRLAFAVSAFLEPDILVIDEVLAVGDAEFQKKCLGKMQDVSAQQGRTILFVSHSLEAIRRICTKGLLLEKGKITHSGSIQSVINAYKTNIRSFENFAHSAETDRRKRTSGKIQLQRVTAGTPGGKRKWSFRNGEDIELRVSWAAKESAAGLGIYGALVSTDSPTIITNFKKTISPKKIKPGAAGEITITLPKVNLRAKYYKLYIAAADAHFKEYYDVLDDNVGLPELEIMPYSMDAHLAIGYFDIITKIESVKRTMHVK